MPQSLHQNVGISLRSIFPHAQFVGGQDIRVTSCTDQWHICHEGDLFVAQTGIEEDGHDFAYKAVAQGAKALLVERLLPSSVPQCIVSDTREAYGMLCHALMGDPSRRLSTIGIAGSSGKTSTQMLLASILATAERPVGVLGSLGWGDGVDVQRKAQHDLPPSEVAGWLARAEVNGCRDAVVEIPLESLATRQTSGLQLDGFILTNVRSQQNDGTRSHRKVSAIQARAIKNLKPHGFVVADIDDTRSQELLSEVGCPVMTVGIDSPAEVTARLLEQCPSEQAFMLTAGHQTAVVRTPIIGEPHRRNCLSAAAAALIMGIDLPTIVRGLEGIDSLPRRMQRIECGQPFSVYLDQAKSSNSLSVALNTISQVAKGRVLCVSGVDRTETPEERALLGRMIERKSDVGVLTCDDPAETSPLKLVHDVLDGYRQPKQAHVLPDRNKAIQWVLDQAKPGDCVLITGDDKTTAPYVQQVLRDQHQPTLGGLPLESTEPHIIKFPLAG